jgi:diaminopimelate decarboxylase
MVMDGGMGDNLEPSLYGQRFIPLVIGRWDAGRVFADLVGRHSVSGDVITPDVLLAGPQAGDVVVAPVTGAYCFTMGNNYNAAPRSAWRCAPARRGSWSGARPTPTC